MTLRTPGSMQTFVLFAAAEGVLYWSYSEQDALFHWFLHFFVGASAALFIMAIVTVHRGRTVPHPMVWIFAGHVIAMLPDLLWNFRLSAHHPWMDVFLAHITAHFLPGRNWTWYAVFLAGVGAYLYARASAEAQGRQEPSRREEHLPRRGAIVGIVLLLLSMPPAAAQAQTSVWIDTDAAPDMPFRDKDDLFALLAALGAPELKIRGISLVFGNHHDVAAAQPGIRELVGRFAPEPIPVQAGAGEAADLGRTTEASTALADALSREGLVIVALGPLTNVATVLRQRPGLASHMTRIVAVAGRRPDQVFRPPHGRLALPDLNFESDVEAFRVVLEHGIPVTLIPFELSRQLWITESDLGWMRNAGGPAARWLARQSAGWLDLWAHGIGVLGFHPFDAPVVTYLLSPRLMRCDRRVPASISTAPLESWWGRHLRFRKPVLLVSNELASPYRVDYCVEIDSRAKHDLLIRINGLARNPVGEVGS